MQSRTEMREHRDQVRAVMAQVMAEDAALLDRLARRLIRFQVR